MQDLQAVINSPEKSPLFHYFWLCCFIVEEIISLWCHIHSLRLTRWLNAPLKQTGQSISSAGGWKQALQVWNMAFFRRARAFGEWENLSQAAPLAPRMRNRCNPVAIDCSSWQQEEAQETETSSVGVWRRRVKGFLPETWWELQHNCRDFRNVPLYLARICVGLFCRITPSIEISESAFRCESKWQLLGSQRWL